MIKKILDLLYGFINVHSLAIGIVLTGVLLWPLVVSPYFSHHDDVQIIRLYEFDKCVRDGQIPCRWVPDLGGLYGYPIFNYYAPLPYYFGEIFNLISGNLIFSVKMMFATAFLGSFIFMYLLSKKLWGSVGGLASALFYMYAPYHSVVFYVRGAMGEMWGLMFFPALLWSLIRLKSSVKVIDAVVMGGFLALLLLSHNLSAMLFLLIFIGFIFLSYVETKSFRFVKLVVMAVSLGLLLSAFYWLPMVTEKDLVHVDTTTSGYFSYTEHFKGMKKLFLDQSWGWGASVREVPGGERDGMSFQIGWVHLLGGLLGFATGLYLWKKSRTASLIILISTVIVGLSIFMINPKSVFIWDRVEWLKYVQFPWRFLMFIILFISLIGGSLFLILDKQKQIVAFIALIILVIFFNFSYFRPEKFIDITQPQLLSGENWDRQIKRSIFDFLPISAKAPPAELATSRYEILTGDTQISGFEEGSNWMRFNALTKTHSIIRLSIYYFPNWKLKVDDKEELFDYKSNSLGLISFILGPGNHKIEARLYDTPLRSLGNLLTVIGIICMVPLILTQIPRTRRWILYYMSSFRR